MRNFIDSLKARQAAQDESGFSLIDVVVTVAIIVALSVGGFVSYSGIVTNAKAAATTSAADQVYTAVAVNANDGGLGNPVDTYNKSSDAIKVYNDGTTVYAVNKAAIKTGSFPDTATDATTGLSSATAITAVKALNTNATDAKDFVATRG